jgi:hypothetical protein
MKKIMERSRASWPSTFQIKWHVETTTGHNNRSRFIKIHQNPTKQQQQATNAIGKINQNPSSTLARLDGMEHSMSVGWHRVSETIGLEETANAIK